MYKIKRFLAGVLIATIILTGNGVTTFATQVTNVVSQVNANEEENLHKGTGSTIVEEDTENENDAENKEEPEDNLDENEKTGKIEVDKKQDESDNKNEEKQELDNKQDENKQDENKQDDNKQDENKQDEKSDNEKSATQIVKVDMEDAKGLKANFNLNSVNGAAEEDNKTETIESTTKNTDVEEDKVETDSNAEKRTNSSNKIDAELSIGGNEKLATQTVGVNIEDAKSIDLDNNEKLATQIERADIEDAKSSKTDFLDNYTVDYKFIYQWVDINGLPDFYDRVSYDRYLSTTVPASDFADAVVVKTEKCTQGLRSADWGNIKLEDVQKHLEDNKPDNFIIDKKYMYYIHTEFDWDHYPFFNANISSFESFVKAENSKYGCGAFMDGGRWQFQESAYDIKNDYYRNTAFHRGRTYPWIPWNDWGDEDADIYQKRNLLGEWTDGNIYTLIFVFGRTANSSGGVIDGSTKTYGKCNVNWDLDGGTLTQLGKRDQNTYHKDAKNYKHYVIFKDFKDYYFEIRESGYNCYVKYNDKLWSDNITKKDHVLSKVVAVRPDGTEEDITGKNTILLNSGDNDKTITVKMVWKKEELQVDYDLRGGEWANGYPTTAQKTKNKDVALTLPTKDHISRSGYIFDGWYDGDGNDYADGASTAANLNKELKMYAKWKRTIKLRVYSKDGYLFDEYDWTYSTKDAKGTVGGLVKLIPNQVASIDSGDGTKWALGTKDDNITSIVARVKAAGTSITTNYQLKKDGSVVSGTFPSNNDDEQVQSVAVFVDYYKISYNLDKGSWKNGMDVRPTTHRKKAPNTAMTLPWDSDFERPGFTFSHYSVTGTSVGGRGAVPANKNESLTVIVHWKKQVEIREISSANGEEVKWTIWYDVTNFSTIKSLAEYIYQLYIGSKTVATLPGHGSSALLIHGAYGGGTNHSDMIGLGVDGSVVWRRTGSIDNFNAWDAQYIKYSAIPSNSKKVYLKQNWFNATKKNKNEITNIEFRTTDDVNEYDEKFVLNSEDGTSAYLKGTTVIICAGSENKIYGKGSWNQLFADFSGLKEIDFRNVDTSEVESMRGLLMNCSALSKVVIPEGFAKNVTTMQSMFQNCKSLASITLANVDTTKVLTMQDMFKGATALKTIRFKEGFAKSATVLHAMFANCTSLADIDISGFDVSRVTNARQIFYGCTNLKTIYVNRDVNKWFTSSNVDTTQLFYNCKSLVGGKGTKYDASKIDGTYARVDWNTLEPGYFTYKNSTDKTSIYEYKVVYNANGGTLTSYKSFTKVYGEPYVSPLAVPTREGYDFVRWNVTNALVAEYNKSQDYIVTARQTTFNIYASWKQTKTKYDNELEYSKVYLRQNWFNAKTKKKEEITSIIFNSADDIPRGYNEEFLLNNNDEAVGYISGTNVIICAGLNNKVYGVGSFRGLFKDFKNLQNIQFNDHIDTSAVTSMQEMFMNCERLGVVNLLSFNTDKLTTTQDMFKNAKALRSVRFPENFGKNVTSMHAMFAYCSKLETIDISNMNVSKVINARQVFYGCTGLKKIYINKDINKWFILANTDTYQMFYACQNLVGGNGTKYNSSKINGDYARVDKAGVAGYFTKIS